MSLAVLGIRILEGMFYIGLTGASMVILICIVEYGKWLRGKE